MRLLNGIPMEYNMSLVYRVSACSADVIFDRPPVDPVSTANQATTDINTAFVEALVSAVKESLDHLDILARAEYGRLAGGDGSGRHPVEL